VIFKCELRSLPRFEGPFDAFKLETKDCDVLVASYLRGTEIPPHHHETENVGVITQGELVLTLNGKDTRHGPGKWFHIPTKTCREI
jgi:quercetin dioxygenase-like cupin family protein